MKFRSAFQRLKFLDVSSSTLNKTCAHGPCRNYSVLLQIVSPDEPQAGISGIEEAGIEAIHNKTKEEM